MPPEGPSRREPFFNQKALDDIQAQSESLSSDEALEEIPGKLRVNNPFDLIDTSRALEPVPVPVPVKADPETQLISEEQIRAEALEPLQSILGVAIPKRS